jgi:hypothetical protein
VLENTYRHLEVGRDRITAAIDGSEEVWSAIVAPTLTHRGVHVPMLFLTGVSSICSASWRRGIVLAGHVTAGRGDDRPGALLAAAGCANVIPARRASWASTPSPLAELVDAEFYAPCARRWRIAAVFHRFPCLPWRCSCCPHRLRVPPQTDEAR